MLYWRDTSVTLVNGTLGGSRLPSQGEAAFPDHLSTEHMGKTRPFIRKYDIGPFLH